MNFSKQKCNFKLYLLSTYRTELMGMAMLGVLIGHLVNLGGFDKNDVLVRVLMVFPKLCFTPTFLFLSGMGIYKSLTSRTISSFYFKRIQRFLLPSIAIILPFNIVFLATGNFTLFEFLSKTGFVSFWFMGNDNGMWYISVSILLYIVAPLLYGIIKDKPEENRNVWGGGFVMLFLVVLTLFIAYKFPVYYQKGFLYFSHSIVFPLGMCVMKMIDDRKIDYGIFIFVIIILVAIRSLFVGGEIFITDYLKCGLAYVVSVILAIISKTRIFIICSRVLKYLGTYSLEIYMLHMLFFSLFTMVFGFEAMLSITFSISLSVLICSYVSNTIGQIVASIFRAA